MFVDGPEMLVVVGKYAVW